MALKFTKLTRPNIRKLPPEGRLHEHGITFDRLANGDGKYSVNIMVDGQRVHRVIGKESEGVTRKQAEEFIEQVRSDARKGRLNLPKGRKTILQFDQAAEMYLKRMEEEGGKDLKMKKMRMNQNLVPFFKSKPVVQISSFDIERYKKKRVDAKVTPSTVNRDLAVLSHLFNKGIEWGWWDHRPARIKRFKENPGRITYLAPDQAARLIEAAKEDQSPHIYPFIVVGLGTGMRRMEILSIRLEHIDLDRKTIYIPNAKAGARTQPMTNELAEFLRGYVETAEPGQEWLFPALGSKTGHTVAIERPFRRVVKSAKLDPEKVVRHTLRHTAITHLVQAGVDLPTVKRISGHKTLSMVEKYAHQNGAHIEAAMDKLQDRLKAAN
ncbi:tyrosine-type recombinase/integrase [Nitrospina watsonii]|uniref:Integrase family protein n=1 Tax=Nitrospina watsonii TaxID=1323948 RepID=A0ABN8W5A2_9BACT|nr:site-specific integrase [Nitrospina watsonii]CAI2719365.1 Integrase family protein [Nitrospina watsonii]